MRRQGASSQKEESGEDSKKLSQDENERINGENRKKENQYTMSKDAHG